LVLLSLAPCLWSQVKLGENTLTASGTAGMGFTETLDGQDVSTLALELAGNLNGSYHDPRFLNYGISPYLNQTNLNSNYHSTTRASGVNAVANFLNTSSTPVQVSYEYDRDAEGTFNVPGQIGPYKTVGNSQNFQLGAAWLPDDLPSIQGSFSHGGSNYDVIGQPGTGTARDNTFGIGSTYELWDTHVSGSYNRSWINTDAPLVTNPGQSVQTTANQGTWQFAANRRLFDFSEVSVNYGHSNLDAIYAGAEDKASFNTVGALMAMTPTARLALSFHIGYSSNLSAEYFSSILNGGTGGSPAVSQSSNSGGNSSGTGIQQQSLNFVSNYLNYGMTSSYQIAHNWGVTGSINRVVQGQAGLPNTTSNIMSVNTTYSHPLLGGSFGGSFGIGYYFAPVYTVAVGQTLQTGRNSTFFGQNGTASYARSFLGWSGSVSGSFAHSLTTLLVGYVQTSYTANGAVSRNLGGWNLALSASYASSHVQNVNISDTLTSGYSLSLAHRNWGVGGGYSQSNGSGVQIGNGIVPVLPGGPLPQFLLLYHGTSYNAGGNFRPLRRWNISASYSHVRYDSQNATSTARNFSNQFYVRSEYYWRQLTFNAGYSYLSQGLGATLINPSNRPAVLQTVFVGVTRRFDFF